MPLRPKYDLPASARSARPREPESIPERFLARPGPAIIEPWASVLQESTLPKRTNLHRCGWKGCDADLASEWHLLRHVEKRRHTAQGNFRAGLQGDMTLYRCHWRGCEQPCFMTEAKLTQHMVARHISRVLFCPYEECDLTSPNISHLSRHVMKQHDSPSDRPRPLATLVDPAAPTSALTPLPETVRTEDLLTPTIRGSVFRSVHRQEWIRLRVVKASFAPDDPITELDQDHMPSMLELHEDTPSISGSLPPSSAFEDQPGVSARQYAKEPRLLDKVLGRKRRWEVVVELPTLAAIQAAT